MDTKTRELLKAIAATDAELVRLYDSRNPALGGHSFTYGGGPGHCLACAEWADACNRDHEARGALSKYAAEEAARPDGPEPYYDDDIATLREMLDEQRGMMTAIEQGVAAFHERWGATPLNVSTLRRREHVAKRVDALITAIEALGGSL